LAAETAIGRNLSSFSEVRGDPGPCLGHVPEHDAMRIDHRVLRQFAAFLGLGAALLGGQSRGRLRFCHGRCSSFRQARA